MMVFKRKQIVVLSLVLMIVVAGYLQYSYKKSSVAGNEGNENGRLGEAVYVTSDGLETIFDEIAHNHSGFMGEDISASQEANDYFAQAKLDKEITRSKNADVLDNITKDANASSVTRELAYSQKIEMATIAENEMKIESLLKERGFSDAIVFFGKNSVDVIVKAPNLTEAHVAQISEIVSRQADVDYSDITVKNKF